MDAVILDSKPLDITLLNTFESEYHLKLPGGYRNFLIKYNGGYPEKNIFTIIINGKKNDGMIHRFLGITHSELDGMYHYINIYKNRIPKDLFPIAYDPAGNLIVIGIFGRRFGKIYFWDHEDEREEPSYRNVHFISNDFSVFINSLRKL